MELWKWKSGCKSKVAFENRTTAKQVAKYNQRVYGFKQQWPYKCEYCGQWHLTSKGKARSKHVPE
jgi:hypothetical protein